MKRDYKMENDKENAVTIKKSIYDALIAKNVISVLRGLYMEKIGTGEMVFNKEIVDLIIELEEICNTWMII